jgi:hypothetical protein
MQHLYEYCRLCILAFSGFVMEHVCVSLPLWWRATMAARCMHDMCTFAVPLINVRRGLEWARGFGDAATGKPRNVYQTDTGRIQLPLVEVHLPLHALREMEMCLGMPDKKLLRVCSTSPPFEGPSFCEGELCLLLVFLHAVTLL